MAQCIQCGGWGIVYRIENNPLALNSAARLQARSKGPGYFRLTEQLCTSCMGQGTKPTPSDSLVRA